RLHGGTVRYCVGVITKGRVRRQRGKEKRGILLRGMGGDLGWVWGRVMMFKGLIKKGVSMGGRGMREKRGKVSGEVCWRREGVGEWMR
ncbi:hypothetical protein, partial [Neisseria sicca]|uniref:hypothetical protein n=1 Tax=Neisseria sicca TaxID=490 RepID=UPI001C99D2B0